MLNAKGISAFFAFGIPRELCWDGHKLFRFLAHASFSFHILFGASLLTHWVGLGMYVKVKPIGSLLKLEAEVPKAGSHPEA